MFVVPLELCVKCYAFVFKSELLRPSHIPYHITIVITNLKKKNPASQKKNRSFCSTSIIDKPKKLRLSLRLTLSLKNCFSAKGGVFPRR